jgi:hypothetical protein
VGLRLTVCVSGGLPREPTNETGNNFERVKPLKRNVANHPLHAVLGGVSVFDFFLNFQEFFTDFRLEFQQNIT